MGGDYSKEIQELKEEIARVGTQLQEDLEQERKALEKAREKEDSLLDKQWRELERGGAWSDEYRQRLITDVRRHKAHQKMDSARILFIGPVNAGKSSFLNSVASIDKNRLAATFLVGSAEVSLSTKLKQFIPKGELKNFILLDTMGLEPDDQEGLIVQNFVYLINGNVLPDYAFNPRQPINEATDKHFIKDPTLEEKPHCTVIVLDSHVICGGRIPDATKQKIKELQQILQNADIQAVIILTKIDKLSSHVREDVTNTYRSRLVKKAIDETSELFGVPPIYIFPVKNYCEEVELHTEIDILILLALRRMMHVASDRLDSMDNQVTSRTISGTAEEATLYQRTNNDDKTTS